MAKHLLSISFLFLFMALAHTGMAQCTGGTSLGALATPTASYQTTSYSGALKYKTFTAVSGKTYNFTFCSNGGSASYDTEITILNNAGVPVAYNDDFCGFQSNLTWVGTANATFRVLVTLFTGGVGCQSNATSATLAYNAIIATPTVTSFTPVNAGTGATVTITGTNFSGATAVSFGGTAATSFTVVSATSITAVVGAGTSGNVSVTTAGGTAVKSGFTYSTSPPANDNCSGAISVAIPSTTAGSTTLATVDNAPSCDGVANGTLGGVWYTVTGNGQKITASTCIGTNFDTQIRVYTGTCTGLICLTGNDDDGPACTTNNNASVQWCSTTGTVYRILVHGFNAAVGNFSLTISGVAAVAVPKPLISLNASNPEAPVLTSTIADFYQWYKDGTPVGTLRTLVVTAPGVYTVRTSSTSGCSSVLSDPFPMIITGDNPDNTNSSVKMYPNPSSDQLILFLGGFEKDRPVAISIFDMQGRVMDKTTGLGQREISFDVKNYAGGKYIVSAQQNAVKVALPFIKGDK